MKYQEKVKMHQRIKRGLYLGQSEEVEGGEEAKEVVQEERQLAQIMLLYYLKKKQLNLPPINGQIKKMHP
jgi:hypothetical protein